MDVFVHAATLRYEVEETSLLEKVTAETKKAEISNRIQMISAEIYSQERELRILLNDSTQMQFITGAFNELDASMDKDTSQLNSNPLKAFTNQQINIAKAEIKVNQSKMLPDISLGYFNQSMIGNPTSNGSIGGFGDRFSGVQVGVTIPIFFGSYKSAIKTAKIEQQIAEVNADYYYTNLSNQFELQLQQVISNLNSLSFYKTIGLSQANLMISNAQKSYESGAIGYIEYFQTLEYGIQIKLDHLNALNNYNQSVVKLQYLLGE